MSHTNFFFFGRATVDVPLFDKGWPGSEVSGNLIQLVCPFKYNDFPTTLIVGTIFIISFVRIRLAYIGVGNHNVYSKILEIVVRRPY